MLRSTTRYFRLYHHESWLRYGVWDRCKSDFVYYKTVWPSTSSSFNTPLQVFQLQKGFIHSDPPLVGFIVADHIELDI